jgi:hypothetical protein
LSDALRTTVRELGWANALLYWLSRALGIATGGRVRLLRYQLVAQPVTAHDLTPPRRGRAIEVTEASRETILATPFDRPAAVIDERLRIGSRCVLAYKGGQLVGFQWFTTRDYPEDEVRCLFELRPEDRCAWDFDIVVQPEARTQPVFLRLWDHCNALLRTEGVRLVLSRINAFNSASVRAHSRLGAQTVATATFLTAGRWQLARLPVAPWLHLSRTSTPRVPISRLARERQKAA